MTISPERVTPIGQGEIIKKERSLEQIRGINGKIEASFRRASQLYDEREKLLKQELNKPENERNYHLPTLLQEDITALDGVIDTIIDHTAQAIIYQVDLQEQILAIEERISKEGY